MLAAAVVDGGVPGGGVSGRSVAAGGVSGGGVSVGHAGFGGTAPTVEVVPDVGTAASVVTMVNVVDGKCVVKSPRKPPTSSLQPTMGTDPTIANSQKVATSIPFWHAKHVAVLWLQQSRGGQPSASVPDSCKQYSSTDSPARQLRQVAVLSSQHGGGTSGGGLLLPPIVSIVGDVPCTLSLPPLVLHPGMSLLPFMAATSQKVATSIPFWHAKHVAVLWLQQSRGGQPSTSAPDSCKQYSSTDSPARQLKQVAVLSSQHGGGTSGGVFCWAARFALQKQQATR